MPKLPTAEALGERPSPQPDSSVVPFRPVAVMGRGEALASLGETLIQIDTELTRARRSSQLTDALGKATADLGELELEFERDADFRTAPQRFKERSDEILARHEKAIDDGIVRDTFKREYMKLQQAKRLNIVKAAFGQEKDYNIATLDQSLDIYATQAAGAANVAEQELVLNQARIAIAEMRRGGWITDVDAGKRERGLLAKVDQARVLRDLKTDPGDTADKLAMDASYATHLDPVLRERLLDQAYTRSEQERREQEMMEEKRARVRGDELLKDAYDKLQAGTLRVRDVQALRDQSGISPAEYRSLLKAVREGRGEGKNDPSAYADLQRLLYSDPEEAERRAFQYHRSGLIKNETLSSVLSSARSLSRQEGPRSEYERGREYITRVLDPGPQSMDPAPKARLGIAVREYEDFAAGGKRTDKELREAADDVVKKYQIINMEDIARRTGIGSGRDPERTLEDLQAQGARAEQMFRDKIISAEEYKRRLNKLNDLRKAAEAARGRP